jgi:hypothetical protein
VRWVRLVQPSRLVTMRAKPCASKMLGTYKGVSVSWPSTMLSCEMSQ